jgi:hypothetical protein
MIVPTATVCVRMPQSPHATQITRASEWRRSQLEEREERETAGVESNPVRYKPWLVPPLAIISGFTHYKRAFPANPKSSPASLNGTW